jgi:hypothetical protein
MNAQTHLLDDIKNLKKYEGKVIDLEYIWYGIKQKEHRKLNKVCMEKDNIFCIEYTGASTPFVGYGTAIQRISYNGKVLYFNPFIRDSYDLRSSEAMLYIQQLSFDIPFPPRIHCHCGMHTVDPYCCERCGCYRKSNVITFEPKSCYFAKDVIRWQMESV